MHTNLASIVCCLEKSGLAGVACWMERLVGRENHSVRRRDTPPRESICKVRWAVGRARVWFPTRRLRRVGGCCQRAHGVAGPPGGGGGRWRGRGRSGGRGESPQSRDGTESNTLARNGGERMAKLPARVSSESIDPPPTNASSTTSALSALRCYSCAACCGYWGGAPALSHSLRDGVHGAPERGSSAPFKIRLFPVIYF